METGDSAGTAGPRRGPPRTRKAGAAGGELGKRLLGRHLESFGVERLGAAAPAFCTWRLVLHPVGNRSRQGGSVGGETLYYTPPCAERLARGRRDPDVTTRRSYSEEMNPFPTCEEFDDRAHDLYEAADYDAALGVLRDGLRRYPEAAALHVALGYVRIAREEWAWAGRSLAAALALDPDQEDAWVGLGETLLKLGDRDGAHACFAHLAELGLETDLEIGLAVGRVLYREGLFTEARTRFTALAVAHPESAEAVAARAYAQHALGDDLGARRDLRRALRLDPALHEARIYLAHLLYDSGDRGGALGELECVPPAEHWDPLSLWRYVELKGGVLGGGGADPLLAPWRARLEELEREPDALDHLLAEVEVAFFARERQPARIHASRYDGEHEVHRIRTLDGVVFVGTWEEIVARMRDASPFPEQPVEAFMRRAALQVRQLTGNELPWSSPEAFVRGSARIGLLRIED